jgi:imidazolonepropionase-like amidohydrolase
VADLILRAATVIDGIGSDPLHEADVVIRDGLIIRVRPIEQAADDACVTDYGDATIMPGLIDCHCHLQFGAYNDHEQTRQVHAAASNEERILTAVANAQKALATGVTTLRDTGGFLTLNMSVRDAFVSGQVVGPRLLVCGAPITTTAGHLNWCGLRADSEEEVVRAVRAMVEAGADFIKVMATGGMMTPGSQAGQSQYDLQMLTSLVNDAHRLDRHVAAHVLGADGCRHAIDAGVDTLEHCSWLTPEGVRGQSAMDMNAVDRIDPTHQSVHMTLAAMNRTPFRGLDHLDALASDERERIRQHGANFREMRQRGVPHVVSSDAGVVATPFEEFPLSVVSAVIALDTTPVDAVQLVTNAAAQAIGLGELTGAVVPGRQADLLVVEGDASENICNITRTASVYLGGREVARNRHLHVNAVRA